jgi:hypothetical protein
VTGVPGVDRPTTHAQDWDATAEAKGRPTVAQLAARRPVRTDRDRTLDFIVGTARMHVPAEAVTDTTTWAVCVCRDGAHPAKRRVTVRDEVAARLVTLLNGRHVVTVRRIVIDVPPVEVP